MIRLSAATRISLTLACLCLSLLFAAQTLGLIPDQSKAVLQSRKTFCKAVASQACWAAQKEDIKSLKEETARLMEKNEGVLSVAVLRANGQYLVQVGDHPSHMQSSGSPGSRRRPRGDPDLQGDECPGARCKSASGRSTARAGSGGSRAPVRLILCLTLSTFLLSRLYLKRVLHHLDPSSVDSRPRAFDARYAGRRRFDHRHESADRAGQQGVCRQVRPNARRTAGLEDGGTAMDAVRTRTRRFPGNWRSAKTPRRSAPC